MAGNIQRPMRTLLWIRIAGGLLTGLMVIHILRFAKREVGIEPAWWYLSAGTIPSVLVLLLIGLKRHAVAYWLAITHDAILLLGLALGLVFLPNYYGLAVMSPLGLFLLEGVILLARQELDSTSIDEQPGDFA